MYLRKLSCGVNPLTEESLPEGDACRQDRISKCLTYVADYLKQKVMPVMERQEKAKAPKPPKILKPRMVRDAADKELVFTPEMLSKFEVSEEPVSVSGIVRRLNFLIPQESGMMPLVYADVAEVLSKEGILLKQEGDKGKDLNLPTPHGEELGFAKVEADIRGHHSIYTKCNVDAQKFILNNIDKCVAQANERLAKRRESAELGETGRVGKEKFHVTDEQIKNYPADEAPVPVSEIARRLNDLLPQDSNVEKIYFKTIRDWFVSQNYLEEKKNALGKIFFVPTETGSQNGIVTESRVGKNGENYDAVLYNGVAQKLVLDHVNELA
ncbi:hypothetical protein [Fibrobacter sp. UWB11]|uniref:hypothetical protein n=1 Tax=Fibrobacter sp. UWB11 TaxID=1896202 RepID=UPI0020C9B462|nr:hypothetical protein [Fibrobacter sp. UWB11]